MSAWSRAPAVLAVVAPRPDQPGGQSVQAGLLAERLRDEGYAVTFVPIDPAPPRSLRWVRRLRYGRTLLNEALYLTRLAGLRSSEVVHIFSASYASFLLAQVPAILAGRILGKRVVLNYHSGEAEDHLTRWGVLVHPWLRMVDQIVVPSEYLRAVFARHGYAAGVVPNVVDASRFRFRARTPLRPRLLTTRSLEPYYRIDITLRAFALLKASYPEATLTIVGHGGQETPLRQLAAALGAGGIRFAGRAEPAAMPGWYDEADIFVNSSVLDNQPVSVLEAFAAGLPVVSTGVGDLANMVRDGETGLLVPTEDPAAIAKAVIRLLEDPDQALILARAAHQQIEHHTWPSVRDRWRAIYAGERREP